MGLTLPFRQGRVRVGRIREISFRLSPVASRASVCSANNLDPNFCKDATGRIHTLLTVPTSNRLNYNSLQSQFRRMPNSGRQFASGSDKGVECPEMSRYRHFAVPDPIGL